MARWSGVMKFSPEMLDANRPYLEKFGVYELGFLRNEEFLPKYIGKAENQTLYIRLRQYFWPSKDWRIPPRLSQHIHSNRNHVWFHIFATEDPAAAERNLLSRHWIGRDGGLYEWNRKYE